MKYIASWSIEIEAENDEMAIREAVRLNTTVAPVKVKMRVTRQEEVNDGTTGQTPSGT